VERLNKPKLEIGAKSKLPGRRIADTVKRDFSKIIIYLVSNEYETKLIFLRIFQVPVDRVFFEMRSALLYWCIYVDWIHRSSYN